MSKFKFEPIIFHFHVIDDYNNSQLSQDLKHAIYLRQEKDKQTDFFRKLTILNDRIHVYQEMFLSNKPKMLDFKYYESKNLV